jgi:glycosyltransferase involved in cell wall biosynthesis
MDNTFESVIDLSVVVPCFNEEDGLDELHRRVTQACRKVVGFSYELVLVDDGSRDETWSRIEALSEHGPDVVGIRLSRNHGHQLALTSGLSVCRGNRILVLDADLQDPPELLGRMMALMDEGADVVYGQRVERKGESWFKKASAAVFYRLLARMVEVPIPMDAGDFRLMSRRAVDTLNAMPEQHRFIRGMVSWIGLRQVALPYERDERFAGTTKYPLTRMVRFAIDATTSFSMKPLRLASYLGAAFGVAALGVLGYTVWAWFHDKTVQGWASVMAVILALGSSQLFMLGIMGEYLGRLYLESKRRPLFVIDKIVQHPNKAEAVAMDRRILAGNPLTAPSDGHGQDPGTAATAARNQEGILMEQGR